MTDILTFNNPEFGSIRSIEQNGEPWFVGKDVARSLGYGDGKSLANAVANHVDEQDKGVTELMTPGGTQKLVIINESGLYSLIFSSKLAGAQRFKRWVTSEVLPSIRKTGCYGTPDFAELSPELRCLIRLEQQQKQQAQELVRLNQKLDQLQGTGGLWHRRLAQGERPDHCPHRTGPGRRAACPDRLSGGIYPAGRAGALQPYRPARSAPQ